MMRRSLLGSFFLICAESAVYAGPAPEPLPPPTPPPVYACVDARNSADYVPGVDARGRPVAPADLPGTVDVQISTEVFAELKSRNPQLRGAGVVVNLPGLVTRPPCPPATPGHPPRKP